MSWILIAFIAPILHGFSVIIDNYLANKLFKNLWTLIFYSSLLNAVFLPFIFLIQVPDLPPVNLLPLFLLIGLIQVFYLFPYYKALQSQDTSVITALFSLGKIFVPILAFLVVKEVLHFSQYVGFLIIIISSAAVTFKGQTKFRLDKSLFYMFLCSFLLSVEAVVYKYLFENVSWSTGFAWPTIFSFAIVVFFLFIPKLGRDIQDNRKNFIKNLPLFTSEEILTFGGSATMAYAISLVPVTIVKGINSFQAFFVLIYAIVLHRFFPHVFKESIDRRSVLRKAVLFLAMFFGVILAMG